MRSTLVFNTYDIVWWWSYHLASTQPNWAMALWVFITKTVKVQISVLTIPDEIYPCFQHIRHCLMMLISPSLNPAKLCHDSLSFHYPCFQHIWHFFMMLMASRFVLAISCHGLPSFHYQDCNFQISVMVFPDEIYPCFQLIWHCLMMLISPSLNPAKLCHGPPSFHYRDCKSSNQCSDCSWWDLPLFSTHMTLFDDAYVT